MTMKRCLGPEDESIYHAESYAFLRASISFADVFMGPSYLYPLLSNFHTVPWCVCGGGEGDR